jgi:hypothetical protein
MHFSCTLIGDEAGRRSQCTYTGLSPSDLFRGQPWGRGNVATKLDLMTTLCGAFGVFSAFGVAILSFFAAGGGLGNLSGWLVKRGKTHMAARRAARWGDALVWLVAGVVAFAVLVSGTGLFTSFFWLQAVSNGSHTASWAYTFAEIMFYMEAVIVTIISVVAVIGGAIAVMPDGEGGAAANQPAPATRQAVEL